MLVLSSMKVVLIGQSYKNQLFGNLNTNILAFQGMFELLTVNNVFHDHP